jgi:tetratricopeptide (TPR) repeat protein
MKRVSLHFVPLLSLVLFAGANQAFSQKLFTNDGKEIPFADVTMQGTVVAWRTKEPSTGNDRITNIPAANITRLDFPEPTDLQEAEALLNRGDAAGAIEKTESVIRQFSPFKITAGSYYVPAVMVKLEGLALLKKDDEFDKLRTELKGINLSPSDQLRLSGAQALQDFSKGLLAPAESAVKAILPKTDDASVLAKLYVLLGDIQTKQAAYPAALESYLSVSVFYGSQSDQLPRAELGAARSLAKMQRLEDARDMLVGLKDRYPTSPQAKIAKEELSAILKTLGQNEAQKADEAEKAEKTEKPATDKP